MGKPCLALCSLSSNLVTFHHEVASKPLDKASRESFSVSADELPTFSKRSYSTGVLSGTRQTSSCVKMFRKIL